MIDRFIYTGTAFVLLVAGPATASPLTVSGPAYVIDGDTVVVAGVHVRLKGVDAAEMNSPLGRPLARARRRGPEHGG